ncbi:glycosyltransferase family 4 protein [Ramlibacter sp. WS9]|uniref:glycosyltransferase family 4 protein n=1 Tax=Ramlibacter sp. WS9 TaxID=1882741 RepID=UPI0013053928|nr:glycosyltransferase family 4 protein [Ramlibacter sp. WS9]
MLALVTDAYGADGGIAQYNRDLLDALSKSAGITEVVVLSRSGAATAGQIPPNVVQLPARPKKILYALAAINVALRSGPFDVVFCGHLYTAPVAAVAAKIAGANLWLQLHGIEAWDPPGRWRRWAAEQARLVTAVSRYTRDRFLGWAKLEPETVKVMPNTVDPRFTPGPRSDALLDRYDLRGKKILLTVSRLAAAERYKGHDLVLSALAALKSQHPDLVYVIAGDGDDLPRLQHLARDLGVAGNTRFTGFVKDEDLPDLYRSADVFVMPSTGEGFGIVFLQAIACGLPVIAADGDGSRDPLRDGADGALVTIGMPESLGRAIEEALARPRDAAGDSPFEFRYFEAQAHRLAVTLAQLARANT